MNVISYLGEIIETWQSIGSQQDAGEFLMYILNGMHEECKEPQPAALDQSDDWSQMGKSNKKVEVRQSGDAEDSPIMRIFGGMTKTTVRSAKAKSDSVSLEAFTMLTLDIVSDDVTDIRQAIGKICAEEKVTDKNGNPISKRAQFKQLPKVLPVLEPVPLQQGDELRQQGEEERRLQAHHDFRPRLARGREGRRE